MRRSSSLPRARQRSSSRSCSRRMRSRRSESMDEALRVREFWFSKAWTGPLPTLGDAATRGHALARRALLWFGSDSTALHQRDELIRRTFSDLLERAVQGELAAWADSPRRRLSLIILLDQFPRHMFRGTPRAFEYDAQ